MTVPSRVDLDESRITEEARSFAAELFARFPELRRHAAMERMSVRDGWTLVVTVPAASGDPRSELTVWVEGGDEPSVEFGDWHTHEGLWGGLEQRA